jgi:hypothetical protein
MVARDMTATVERRTEVDGAAGVAGQALRFPNPLYPPKNGEGEATPLPLADCVTFGRLLVPRRPDRHWLIRAAVF